MSWEMVKLGDVGDIISGSTPKTTNESYWGGDINWITPAELIKGYNGYISKTERTLTGKGFKASSLHLLPKDSVLLTSRAPIGKVGLTGIPMCTNQGFKSIVCNEKMILSEYLYHFLVTQYDQLNYLGRGATFKEISKRIVEQIPIPLPPLPVQKRIVELLDRAQSLIDSRKEQIALMDQLIQSLFYDMFGDPVKNPMGWEMKKLGAISNKITDGTHHSPKSLIKGIPYISAKHLKKTGLDFYINPVYISENAHKSIYSRCNPIKGDVLYIKDGATTGIAAINQYDFEFSMLSSLALIKVKPEKLNNYYLTYYLNNDRAKIRLISIMSGGAIKRLTLKKIKAFIIPVPPISQQNKFAERVEEIEKQKAAMAASLQELEDNFKSLMQRAFKGDI